MPAYAGDVTSKEAWDRLSADQRAALVDVRTAAEWTFVGICDLSVLGRQPLLLSWQTYPAMEVNPDFTGQLAAAGLTRDTPLYFLCRSGARSRAAAMAAAEAGFSRSYNISDGFEGDPDASRHRSQINGWKYSGLPWVQN